MERGTADLHPGRIVIREGELLHPLDHLCGVQAVAFNVVRILCYDLGPLFHQPASACSTYRLA